MKSCHFVLKSVEKCGRTSHAQKRAARTHIAHTFQNDFRTHTHTCDRTSHVCVRARTFATHALQNHCTRSQQNAPFCKQGTIPLIHTKVVTVNKYCSPSENQLSPTRITYHKLYLKRQKRGHYFLPPDQNRRLS